MKILKILFLLCSVILLVLALLLPTKVNVFLFIALALFCIVVSGVLILLFDFKKEKTKKVLESGLEEKESDSVLEEKKQLESSLAEIEKKYENQNLFWKKSFADLEQMYHTANELLLYTELEEEVIETESKAIDSVVVEFENIRETNERVEDHIGLLSDSSKHVRKNSHESYLRMQKTNDLMVNISDSNKDLKQSVEKLIENTRQIEKFLSNISKVANKTRTLSINAAIEASKSGAEGAGFAVLAREIRTLAENTGLYAKNINQLLSTIQENSSNVIKSMDDSSQKIDDGMNLFDETSEYMGSLEDEMKSFDKVIQKIGEVIQSSIAEIKNTFSLVSSLKDASQSTNENTLVLSEKAQDLSKVAETTINEVLEHAEGSKVGSLMEALTDFKGEIEELIKKSLQRNEFSKEELFEPKFEADPEHKNRYTCKYQPFLDNKLCLMIDSFMKRTPGVLNIVILDQHLFSVTSGSKYNQPLTGDALTDIKINFTRMFYKDNERAVHLDQAVGKENPFYISSYPLKEFKMAISDMVLPIFIDGEKWGVLRAGFNPKLLS